MNLKPHNTILLATTDADITDLLFVHPLTHVAKPLPDLVALHKARVPLVEALKRGEELRLRVKVVQVLAHHGEEHRERDPAVGPTVLGRPAGVCTAEAAPAVSRSVGEELVEC